MVFTASLYKRQIQRAAESILNDDFHPLLSDFKLLPSGWRFLVPKEQSATTTILFLLLSLRGTSYNLSAHVLSLIFTISSSVCNLRNYLLPADLFYIYMSCFVGPKHFNRFMVFNYLLFLVGFFNMFSVDLMFLHGCYLSGCKTNPHTSTNKVTYLKKMELGSPNRAPKPVSV